MTLEQLDATLNLACEFRRQGMSDILNIEAIVWHSWFSVTNLRNVKQQQHAVSTARIQPADPVALARRARYRHAKSQVLTGAYRCPDPVCVATSRTYHFMGLWNHMYVTKSFATNETYHIKFFSRATHFSQMNRGELTDVLNGSDDFREHALRYAHMYERKRYGSGGSVMH